MSMNPKSCLICNSVNTESCISIFDSESILKSGTKLGTIVNKILDEQVTQTILQSNISLCKSCYEYCTEYDELHSRLSQIKTGLKLQHKSSLKVDTKDDTTNSSKPNIITNKLVQIKTEPPNFTIKVLPANTTIASNTITSQAVEVKAGTSLLNKNATIKYPNVNILKSTPKIIKVQKPSLPQKKLQKLAPKTSLQELPKINLSKNPNIIPVILPSTSNILANSTSLLQNAKTLQTTNSLLQTMNASKMTSMLQNSSSFLQNAKVVTSLPMAILRNNLTLKTNDYDDSLIIHEPMEIDEECTYVQVNTGDVDTSILQADDDTNTDVIKIIPATDDKSNDDSSQDSDYVIGKVEIMEDDNDLGDDHAIIMEEGENGSIIRLVSGQKFIYNNKEISLIIPEADSDKEDDANDLEDTANVEESQIEIKMAGDEKTANAIKDAASNHGTTYVKTETGEMFEVESVATEKEKVTNDAPGIVTDVGDRYKCMLCENHKAERRPTFMAEGETMMRHIREVHHARVYICITCRAVMRKRSDYTDHVTMHVEELAMKSGIERSRHYQCRHCAKRFASENILKEHMTVHEGNKAHMCEQCNKTFASKYTYLAHTKIHTDRPRPFKCSECEKSFYTGQNLAQHSKIHQVREEFECLVCHKTFGSQHNLEVHGIVHSGKKPFQCGICSKNFARRAEIRDHLRIHTGERPFKCDICGSAFSQRSNLQSHKRATHFNDQRYQCNECPKRFKRRRLLDYHVMACHTGERPFKCELCDSSFIYPEHYKKHMVGHTGHKPYECNICKKAFSSRDNRNVHMYTHSDRKPYECVECGANYMRKPQLLAHMKATGHLSEKIIINNQPKFYTVNEEYPKNSVQGNEIDVENTSDNSKLLITNKGIILREDTDNGMYTVDFDADNAQQLFTTELADGNITNETEIDAQTETVNQNEAEIAKDNSSRVMFRLVQMKLEDGGTGWVTLEE